MSILHIFPSAHRCPRTRAGGAGAHDARHPAVIAEKTECSDVPSPERHEQATLQSSVSCILGKPRLILRASRVRRGHGAVSDPLCGPATSRARRGRSSTCVTCLRGHAGRSGSRSRARGGRSARSSSSCWLAAGCCVVQCCTPHAAGAGSAKYSSSSVMTSDGVLEGTNSGHPRSVSAPGAHVGGWTVLQETRKVGWQKC